jgi:chromosome segregation ATPase
MQAKRSLRSVENSEVVVRILSLWPRSLCVVALATIAACVAPDEPRIPAPADEPPRVRESRAAAFASPGEQDGSLAQLTAEVRQLRLAVEELARSQAETRALEASLSTQQTRMLQTEQRLEAARRGIDTTVSRGEGIEARLASLRDARSRATALDARASLDEEIRSFEAERDDVARELQRVRRREDELSRTLQDEETRWNDLVMRLEALAR